MRGHARHGVPDDQRFLRQGINEVTDILKNDRKTAHIPVIAMTANVMKKDREHVFKAGCDGYISKPIDVDELPGQIENFLKGAYS